MTRPTAFSPQITQAQFPAIAAHHITHSATATPTTEMIFGQGFRQTISLFHAPFYKRWDVEWRYLSSDALAALTEFLAEQGGLSLPFYGHQMAFPIIRCDVKAGLSARTIMAHGIYHAASRA